MEMEQTSTTSESPSGLMTLLLAGWRHRVFLLLVTALGLMVTAVYSFLMAPVFTAQVTILPQFNSNSNSLLRNLASIVGPSTSAEGTYEQLYSQILKSDRILDRAIAQEWRHIDHSEPVSLYRIFDVDDAVDANPTLAAHALKKILQNEVVAFQKYKGNGYMVLKVSAPRDGAFAADLANFLVDQLDHFNREIQSRIAMDQHTFVSERLAEVETKLHQSEEELVAFKKQNRAYTSSPDLMQRYGEINREVQAQTAIWVELRRQVELAAIEMNKEKPSVDILDRATPPVVKSKPQRPLYWAAGLLIGFAVAVALLFLRHQYQAIRHSFAA